MTAPTPPYQAGDIDPKTFGSGGSGLVPGQGNPAVGDFLEDILARLATLEGEEGGKTFQSGTGALTAGDSGAIAATITASSRIYVTRKAAGASTSLGELTANNRVVGAPGSFKVQALTPGTPGTPLAADVSTFDWLVYG